MIIHERGKHEFFLGWTARGVRTSPTSDPSQGVRRLFAIRYALRIPFKPLSIRI